MCIKPICTELSSEQYVGLESERTSDGSPIYSLTTYDTPASRDVEPLTDNLRRGRRRRAAHQAPTS